MNLPWWLPIGAVPELAAHEMALRLENEPDPQILDVRTAMEYGAGHIASAVSVPIQSFRQQITSLDLDAGRPVYVICLTSHRSIPAVRLLRAQGYEAYQLASGMNAWWRQGLPTVR